MTRPDLPVAACPTAEDHSVEGASPSEGSGGGGDCAEDAETSQYGCNGTRDWPRKKLTKEPLTGRGSDRSILALGVSGFKEAIILMHIQLCFQMRKKDTRGI